MGNHQCARAAMTSAATTALLAAVAGCGLGGQAVATWQLAPGQALEDGTTSFTAAVTRLGCNSGVTGKVNDPRIEEGGQEVTITFTVGPERAGGANCVGNEAVPYRVRLPSPLAGQVLVDGACTGAEAAKTMTCTQGATRSPT